MRHQRAGVLVETPASLSGPHLISLCYFHASRLSQIRCSRKHSARQVSPIMVVGLALWVRTIGQRHGEHSERTAEGGNGHHPVDAQGWNEETHC